MKLVGDSIRMYQRVQHIECIVRRRVVDKYCGPVFVRLFRQ